MRWFRRGNLCRARAEVTTGGRVRQHGGAEGRAEAEAGDTSSGVAMVVSDRSAYARTAWWPPAAPVSSAVACSSRLGAQYASADSCGVSRAALSSEASRAAASGTSCATTGPC